MLSSPWSLEFVLAVIIGAMLVPGCRPNGSAEVAGAPSRVVEAADRSVSPPVGPVPVEPAHLPLP